MLIKIKEGKFFEGSIEQSVLDSAVKSGLVFEYSCKTGQCGVCKTTLLEGEVFELQAQLALTEQEQLAQQFLTCCCAPKTDILIDSEDLQTLHGIELITLPVKINKIKRYVENIIEVTLRLPPNVDFKFIPGQYLDVIQNNIRRSYSISSTANQKLISLLIKKFENGKMSEYWFNQAKENDLLRIEGPKGTFFLRDSSLPIIFLATGTGIAPIISILNTLDESKDFIQKKSFALYWGNRYEEEFVYEPVFRKIKIQLIKVCSRPGKNWKGDVGHVQDILLKSSLDFSKFAVYACGSHAMIQSAKKALTKAGLLGDRFYSDSFLKNN